MEKLPAAKHERRSPKSNKKKQVKVVYISNPMKIKATPSEFRAVVQQFTGRYATSPPPHELAGIVKNDNYHHQQQHQEDEEEKEQQQLDKWQLNSTSIDARCTIGSNLRYESGCHEDQVMQELILTPHMLEGFPSPEFGSS